MLSFNPFHWDSRPQQGRRHKISLLLAALGDETEMNSSRQTDTKGCHQLLKLKHGESQIRLLNLISGSQITKTV